MKFFHLQEFGYALEKLGVEYKLVRETEYVTGFPSKDVKGWFSKKKFHDLIKDYKPDVVFCDCQSHFALETIKLGVPCFTYLRGNRWMEVEWAKKTIYKDPLMKKVLEMRHNIAERVFTECQGIFMTADYLDKVIKEHIPNAKTIHFLEGLDASRWYPAEGMTLKHPCVGMCHDANWWGKTKEMLTLKHVLEKMPDVNFYWAGDGPFREKIVDELGKFENFHWLGKLDYPDKVREFLSEIDVYALITGMDLAALSLKEAQLMKRPVIATNVGGNPEMMKDNVTGYLVEKGNHEEIIEKISLLLKDKELSQDMGNEGRKFIEETYSWEVIAKNFIRILNENIKK